MSKKLLHFLSVALTTLAAVVTTTIAFTMNNDSLLGLIGLVVASVGSVIVWFVFILEVLKHRNIKSKKENQ